MSIIYTLDLFGTLAFAISGFITASHKRFDIFGASVIAFVTALGGGTIRDVLLGTYPLAWVQDPYYIAMILLAIVLCLLFQSHLETFKKPLFLFDTLGISIFTLIGLQKTLLLGHSALIAIIMGTVSAVFGGVIRDTLANEVPLIFRKELYATTCILGGCLYFTLDAFFHQAYLSDSLTLIFITVFRMVAVKYAWALPVRESKTAE